MPEGPSIVILREEAAVFARKTVRAASGNAKLDLDRMKGRRILAMRSWGKHFLIQFSGFSLRIHLLMFGTYRINEDKPSPPRVRLEFDSGHLNFYTCSARYIEGDLDQAYDWEGDVMSAQWNPTKARRKLKARGEILVCDALLDQDVFAGVGNIIKNEVLFRTLIHPCSQIGALPPRKLSALIREARQYSFDFLEWKRRYVLRQHWLVHTRRTCPRCGRPLSKAHLGATRRRSFFCEKCQVRYEPA
ncbi:MAG: endonuclease [Lysobacteraceae bacterium]|nr:MAG: endonuclease [Xanthomonadaceae bacterium]